MQEWELIIRLHFFVAPLDSIINETIICFRIYSAIIWVRAICSSGIYSPDRDADVVLLSSIR